MVHKINRFLIFFVISTFSLCAFAQKNRKTVGDILNKIVKQEEMLRKKKSSLPKFTKVKRLKKVNLRKIKPPSSAILYYDEGSDGLELEKATDRLIADAYKLTEKFKKSSRRGELWLRLAELYVEKSRLIELRLQDKYDLQLEAYHSGKRKSRPRLNLRAASAYNQKAIQLYLWFLRDYPKDSKRPQALFLLGYNYFELGDTKKGREYYLRLTKEHPRSAFVEESHFSLGEFYFENEKWEEAIVHYKKVTKNPSGKLYSFALYKTAWCQYKMGRIKRGLKSLEKVIYMGRVAKGREKQGGRVSRIRLASEAVKDIVPFYAEVGSPKDANEYFARVVGDKSKIALMKRLAHFYADSGNYLGANTLFKSLISMNPLSPNAYEYQYKIVQSHSSVGRDRTFRKELFKWVENYTEDSDWFNKNSQNQTLVSKSTQLIESTLRNYVLQTHQTAQKSKSPYTQKQVQMGYEVYFNTFKKSTQLGEMHFFYAEFLYELKKFAKASFHYSWIVNHRPKSSYYKSAILNAALSLEKLLPTPKEIKVIVGKRSEPVPMDKRVKSFEAVTKKYIQAPRAIVQKEYSAALQYRLGSLYYYYNQFDLALDSFNAIIKKFPKMKQAEYAANLILDIYNIKKDYKGLVTAANQLLEQPSLSSSKLGSQIRDIRQRSAFKQAEEEEKTGNYEKAGEAYEEFIQSNPQSSLAIGARFNAAVNFEKAGLLNRAAATYRLVLLMEGKKEKYLKNKATKFLAIIYEKIGRYEEASRSYETYAQKNPQDSVSMDFLYNAAIIQDGMKHYESALKNYQKYYDKSRDKNKKEVFFLMGKIWEKRENFPKAIQFYEKCIEGGLKNKSLHIEVTHTIAKLNKALNRKTNAKQWYEKTVALHKRLVGSRGKEGLRFAAEAKFELAYNTYLSLLSIQIPSGSKQQAIVQKKLKMMNQLKEELASVIKYNDGEQIVAALTVQGQALQHMADSIYSAPFPKQLKGKDLEVYKKEIDKIARPFKEQALSSYESAIEKGLSFQAYNSWLKLAMVNLRQINPEAKSVGHDYKIHLTKLIDKAGL